MDNELIINQSNIFESIKHIDSNGLEFWYAREFAKVLEYYEWRKFRNVLKKAQDSCINSNNNILDHFVQVDKMVTVGSNAHRKIEDFKLTRYACYLVVQNADPRKPIVALGQTYFAIQTRKQEILEQEQNEFIENQRRIKIR